MFYVEKPDSQPRVYELTDKVPEPTGPYRRYITKFEQTPEFIVHSKMHGTHEKPQPYVVRGVSKRGELLVQATVATEYEPIGRWLEVDCGNTVEGYRFKRYLLKPIATLIKLASDAAKVQARDAKQRAHQADRDEKCGSCPVCFGDYVVTNKLDSRQFARFAMVHHGYERPGVGYIIGDCHGVGFEPFEVSCEGTKSWLVVLGKQLAHRETLLAGLGTQDAVVVVTGMKTIGYQGRRRLTVPEHKTLHRGEPGFDRAIENLRSSYTREIETLKRDIKTYTKHIADWKPQPFPRAARKDKAS